MGEGCENVLDCSSGVAQPCPITTDPSAVAVIVHGDMSCFTYATLHSSASGKGAKVTSTAVRPKSSQVNCWGETCIEQLGNGDKPTKRSAWDRATRLRKETEAGRARRKTIEQAHSFIRSLARSYSVAWPNGDE